MSKDLRLPLALLVVGAVAFAASLVWANSVLPAQVAAHFNAAGVADNFLSRERHLALMALLGFGLPLLMAGIFYAIRWLPTSIVNLPNREFWLAPERRARTSAMLFRRGLWFAWLELVFVLLIHLLVVQANRAQPARLSSLAWVLLVAFLIAVGVWLVGLYRQFRLPAAPAARR